jgi:hypothetical protein
MAEKRASGAKKAGAQRTGTEKTGTSRTTDTRSSPSSGSDGSPPRKRSAPKAEAPRRATATQVAARAASQLLELAGKEPEGVTGLSRDDDGWTVEVEVVEVRRIPNTTDVLALYEVTTDEHGDLLGYRRLRRYARGTPGED